MPLPSPRNKEKRGDFVNRCMADLSKKGEFKDNKQRAAVCYDAFKKAEAKASITTGEGDDQILYFSESDERYVTEKKEITQRQYSQDARELQRETLKERLKHHEDAIKNIQSEIAALEKDMREDKSDVKMESDGAKTKKQWDKIDKKELKRDTKKEKVKHEKDAIEDDKEKIKKLGKGKPSEKKRAEKKALTRDIKYDKKSKETYAAERYGGKKRSALKDSDFLDPKRRSFPVVSCQDVKDAVSSWGRYKGSMTFDQFKAKLTRRAKKLGCGGSLPKSWTKE
jgi:hypothetical protein